jgi:hypothetical protein
MERPESRCAQLEVRAVKDRPSAVFSALGLSQHGSALDLRERWHVAHIARIGNRECAVLVQLGQLRVIARQLQVGIIVVPCIHSRSQATGANRIRCRQGCTDAAGLALIAACKVLTGIESLAAAGGPVLLVSLGLDLPPRSARRPRDELCRGAQRESSDGNAYARAVVDG